MKPLIVDPLKQEVRDVRDCTILGKDLVFFAAVDNGILGPITPLFLSIYPNIDTSQ